MKMTFFHPGTKVPPAPAIPQTRVEPTRLNPNATRFADVLRHYNDPGSTTRREVWYCESADGLWHYERLDMPGTPWVTYHAPSNLEVGFNGSLDAARAATADGTANVNLQRIRDARKAS